MDLYIDSLLTGLQKMNNLQPLSYNEICSYPDVYRTLLFIYYGYTKCVKKINDNGGVQIYPYSIPVFTNNIKMMKHLEKIGYDIRNFKANINLYLTIASQNGNFKMLKYLVKKGLNINAKHEYESNLFNKHSGENLYIWAISCEKNKCKIKILKYLENIGINIYSSNKYESNAYDAALFFNQYKIIKFLETKDFHFKNYKKIKLYPKTFSCEQIKFISYKLNYCCFTYFLFILFIFVW